MAKYLIAGALGFVGTKVSELLLTDGHAVVGIDAMDDCQLQQMRLAGLEKHSRFEFHDAYLNDKNVLSEAIDESEKIDAVFNLTAISEAKQELSGEKFADVHIAGTQQLLELCKERGIGKLIQASTSSVYGSNVAVLPILETVQAEKLSDPIAIAEKSAEDIAHGYHVECGIEVATLRYFDVYGPGSRTDSLIMHLCDLIHAGKPVTIFGDGRQRKGLSYIDDVARGTVQTLGVRGYQKINLGGHELISLNRLIHLVEKEMGKEAIVSTVSGELSIAVTQFPDLNRASNILGWKPEVSLEDGVRISVEWFCERGNYLA